MSSRLKTSMVFLCLLFLGALSHGDDSSDSGNSQGKEFLTSVIYGTVAGALVGAATLAFTDSPGDNLGNIARGASIGLYAGIILGAYVTHSGSDNPSIDMKQAPSDDGGRDSQPGSGSGGSPSSSSNPMPESYTKPTAKTSEPLYGFSLFPVIDRNHIDGIGANVLRLHF